MLHGETLTRKLFVFPGQLVVPLANLAQLDAHPGELGVKAAVVVLSVVELTGELVHAALQLTVDVLGLLQTLAQILYAGTGLQR